MSHEKYLMNTTFIRAPDYRRVSATIPPMR
jgi:hypothetical protein